MAKCCGIRCSGPQEMRPALMALFSGLFVRLHRLDWRPWVAEGERESYRPETILRKEFDLLRSLAERVIHSAMRDP